MASQAVVSSGVQALCASMNKARSRNLELYKHRLTANSDIFCKHPLELLARGSSIISTLAVIDSGLGSNTFVCCELSCLKA